MNEKERKEYVRYRIESSQKSDYDNIFDYDNETVQPLFKPVEEFINLIVNEINTSID